MHTNADFLHREMLLKVFGFIPDRYHEYILPVRVEVPNQKAYFDFPINHPVIDIHDAFLVDRMYMVLPPTVDYFSDQYENVFMRGHLRISVNNVILSYLNIAPLVESGRDFFPVLPRLIFSGCRINKIECNLPTAIGETVKPVFVTLYLRGWYFPGVQDLK